MKEAPKVIHHSKWDSKAIATETLRALAHPVRMELVRLLANRGAQTVTQLHESLDIKQSVASHHLNILKNKKVVNNSRVGKRSYYSLTDKKYYQLLQTLFACIKK